MRHPSRCGRAAPLGVAAFLIASSTALAAPPPADAWRETRFEHVTVISNAGDAAARAVGLRVERARGALAIVVPGIALRSRAPFRIYLFRDAAAMRPYARVHASSDSNQPAGYFRTTPYARVLAVTAKEATDPFFQTAESAYLADLLRSSLPAAPPWLAHGLGRLLGGLADLGEKVEIGRPAMVELTLLRASAPIPVHDLFGMPAPDEAGTVVGTPSVFDAESWALVHELLIGSDDLRPKALAFLEKLEGGVPSEAAFHATLGAEADGLDASLAAYARRPSLRYLAIPVAKIPVRPPSDPSGLSRPDALASLGWLLASLDDVNTHEAEGHFRAALALDPGHASSEAGLAYLRTRENRFEEAAALYDAAIGHGAADSLTLLLAARNLVAKVGAERAPLEAPNTLPDDVARARTLLKRSLAEAPDDPESLAALGATYLYDPGDVAPGIAALEAASAGMPPRSDVLCNRVALLARGGRRDDAQALIDGPIAALRDPGATNAAREGLAFADLPEINAKIAAGDLDGAVAILERDRDAAPTPRLRAHFDAEIARIAPVARRNRDVARYNEAVKRVNAGDWKGAAELLDQILAGTPDADMKKRAQALLERARSGAQR